MTTREGQSPTDAEFDAVFAEVYAELRRLARRQRRGAAHTLTTTALVHETFLKLDRARVPGTLSRPHFFALAARAMRQLLIDHARRKAVRADISSPVRVTLDVVDEEPALALTEVIGIDRAMARLAELDPALAELVDLRVFAGLKVEDIAQLRDVTERTVYRDWRRARAFLLSEIQGAAD